MRRTTTLVIALWAVFVAPAAFGQKGNEQQLEKEANALFNSAEYLKAYPLYSQLVSLYPNQPDYNYKFGACAIFSEPDKSKAVKYLTIATNKGAEDKMVWYYLGKAYHLNYQFKDAIRAYENFLRNADPKVSSKTDAQREIETCIYGSNLLSNIKDIDVISKTESDKANFFRYFNLEAIGGKILTVPEELKTKLDMKSTDPGVIHYPGNSTTIYFSSLGKDGSDGRDIYKANILPDGKFSTPEKLKGDINTRYDEDYCFMHSDGKTLYFSSRGHNSMGGYDIFKSELDPQTGTFGPAINLDFAINTPDDDIFYIADSLNKKAYFASGRTSDLNHLNVYNVMVEGTPLQVVYIKGEFISEIDPMQKKAGMKVIDPLTGRMVCDGNTGTAGNYLMYVPKSGEYTFKVVTENGPMVHELRVKIPTFNEPVAIRQEMRLVSEGGKDKIILTNYFDAPLDEDLSALAADMLRKKSMLEVNTKDAPTASATGGSKPAELSTLEKTMTNAPVAAGFVDGTTVQSVIVKMETEVAAINTFVKESDQKYDNSISYSAKKEREAEAALSKGEAIRKSLSSYSSDEDIQKLRQSVALVDQAAALRIEAQAALNAAESVKQYKTSESERAQGLLQEIAVLRQAESSGNVDGAIAGLTKEKERETAMRDGVSNSPYDELMAKAKARESEQQRAEEKLSTLRDDEKSAAAKMKVAEDKMSAAKKEKDKRAAETELVNAKSALDNIRRNIVDQTVKVETLGDESKTAYANAELFKRLAADTNMGLKISEQVKLSETEKTALNMKLGEMKNRVNSLEITDPAMLAMITDASSTETVAAIDHSEMEPGPPPATSATAAIPVATSSRPASDVKTISSQKASGIAKAGSDPANAPARRMFIAQGLAETNAGIRALEVKKRSGSYTVGDNNQLTELMKLRGELQAEMAKNGQPAAVSMEEVSMAYSSVIPEYAEETQAITNSQGDNIDRTLRLMAYKEQTIEKFADARAQNASAALAEPDPAKLADYAKKDQRLEAAMTLLEKANRDMEVFSSAYEKDNKLIIESDDAFAGKMDRQIHITESYLGLLNKLEAGKQEDLDLTSDINESTALRIQIGEIKQEKEAANAKLAKCNEDLVASRSAAEKETVRTNPPATTLEDAITNDEARWNFDAPKEKEKAKSATATPDAEQDAKQIEKIFKPREEPESIFAYESGVFEEIVAQHQSEENKLKNRDKITEINDQIFLTEAEMENEQNPGKLRKLDYKAEQLYLRRSMIEIDNSSAISNMTKEEYTEELKKADHMTAENRSKIDSRIMVKEEVDKLRKEAERNFEDGAAMRENGPSVVDDIERADLYRQAFAKEALAIDQLRQIQSINENIDLLTKYQEQDLAQLRTGKAPSSDLAESMAADLGTTGGNDISVPDEPLAEVLAGVGEEEEFDAGGPPASNEAAVTAAEKNTSAASEMTANNSPTAAEPVASSDLPKVETSKAPEADITGSQVLKFSTNANGDIVTDSKTVTANRDAVSMNLVVNDSPGTSVPAKAEVTIPANATKEVTSPVMNEAPANTAGTMANKSGTKNASNTDVAATASNTKPATGTGSKTTTSKGTTPYAPGADSQYYFSAPSEIVADLFTRTKSAVYSDGQPIPIDIAMPKGVYYKVQIGAFRNDIPQNLYDEFAPVCGETVGNGITRYTAGFFPKFENADKVKKEIRGIGYADAFIVAYRDGKRIPLYEAIGKTDGEDFAAAIEKEYIHGDKGEAPKANIQVTKLPSGNASSQPSKPKKSSGTADSPQSVFTVASNPAASKGDYYKASANTAKATPVEITQGLFYTVQVGVYSKPVTAKSLYNINPLNTELTDSRKIRYTSGIYTSLASAVDKRAEARSKGINDAFITAYYNGKRITISEADRLIKEKGPSILAKKTVVD